MRMSGRGDRVPLLGGGAVEIPPPPRPDEPHDPGDPPQRALVVEQGLAYVCGGQADDREGARAQVVAPDPGEVADPVQLLPVVLPRGTRVLGTEQPAPQA